MSNGYHNKILRIDLSTGNITTEEPGENFYRMYSGGRAFIARYLLKELKAGIDPLSPDNKLIFATGLITGSPVPGASRCSIGAKSPLTGGYGDAEVGGFWPTEFKRTGYDALIIEGRATEPCYLYITDENIEIRKATHIWGKLTGEAEKIIKDEVGERVRICQIGPAGEKQIPYACVTCDLVHFAGRCGIGAVMGSKNLRAIAVKGSKKIPIARPEKLNELAKWMAQNFKSRAGFLYDQGTAASVDGLQAGGGLPTRNFQSGVFEYADKINGKAMSSTILKDRENCFACPVFCKRVVETKEPYFVNPIYGGPEYETIGSLGSNCGVGDLEAISKASELCNSHGLDTIGAGLAISFAMECYEKGIIKDEDNDGDKIEFGDADDMLKMLNKILNQEGFGKILGLGLKKASQIIGKGSEKFALHVKNQAFPAHMPRMKYGMGIGYAISGTGADHCHNMHDNLFQMSTASLHHLGVLNPLPALQVSAEKVRILYYFTTWRHALNSMLMCTLVPWSADQILETVQNVTGWNFSVFEMMKIGERASNLIRLFNLREGFTASDDTLPDRCFEEMPDGPLAGKTWAREEFEEGVKWYYAIAGWSKKGVPTEGKLAELDILWAKKDLKLPKFCTDSKKLRLIDRKPR